MPHLSPPPRVTIVITQRERFSATQECLASLIANTPEPFQLILVTSRPRCAWLERLAEKHGFRLVRSKRALTPAEARNLGLQHADTEYAVFAENDVVFNAGWLSALVACADETAASIVAPLTCEGRPVHTVIHHVGPVESNRDMLEPAPDGRKDFHEEFYLQGQTLEEARELLVRRKTQCFEFHCVLMRRDLFDRLGPFDPDIVSKEYLDLSWRVLAAGGAIWLEPKAVVTFLIPSDADPIKMSDLPYFLLRWSNAWQKRSHDALAAKWGLHEQGYIASRRALSNWRVVHHIVKPMLARTPILGRRWGFVARAASLMQWPFALAGAFLAWRYDFARSMEARHKPHAAS